MVSVETSADCAEHITDLLGQLAARFTTEDDAEQQWMLRRCSPQARRAFAACGVGTLHVLAVVPREGDGSTNLVGLVREAGVAKGTVSKAVRRLADLGLVERHRIEGNRKEVHVRVTSLGEEIRSAHEELHREIQRGLHDFLAQYPAADLQVVTRIMRDLLATPRDGIRLAPEQVER